MSIIKENYSLEKHNTFGIRVNCRRFYESDSLPELISFIKKEIHPGGQFLVLGEGSNVLFTRFYDGTIIHPALKGVEILSEDNEHAIIKAGAGENWDEFVRYCVEQNLSGLENLSLIPGSVGSSPVQNIGAYGVEVKDCIEEVEGFYIEGGEKRSFSNLECRFDYRNSIFKQDLKGQFIITAVSFKLNKNQSFQLGYGSVEKEFLKKPVQNLAALRQTIIEIRESKLPDPVKYGNAGSFFKNPIVPSTIFEALLSKFPEMPGYHVDGNQVKVPAAWLIEHAGWKGIREGNTGTYPNQPLVIVNYGNASGTEIYSFAMKIIAGIREKFGITLEMEVNLL